jgi:hypothetical protein
MVGAPAASPIRNCDPAYPDVCLHQGIGDYDCAGGSGNGPNYVEGPLRVLPQTRSTWTATTTTKPAARAARPTRHPSPRPPARADGDWRAISRFGCGSPMIRSSRSTREGP